jgi:hypothetical protein
LYIVNFAVRLLVLAFVFVGGAITFAGPQSNDSVSVEANESANFLRRTRQETSTTERSPDSTQSQDVG